VRRAVAVAVAVALAVVAMSTLAQAAPITSASDARGDVTIYQDAGPPTAARKSIDLRWFQVSTGQLDEPSVRFTFRIKRISTSRTFVQGLHLSMRDADPALPDGSADLSVTIQNGIATTYVVVDTDGDGDSTGIACGGVRPIVQKRTATVKYDLPLDCVPPGLLRLRVESLTIGRHAPVFYSSDVLKVPGKHDLGGTASEY
jgi:hypothetical protein